MYISFNFSCSVYIFVVALTATHTIFVNYISKYNSKKGKFVPVHVIKAFMG